MAKTPIISLFLSIAAVAISLVSLFRTKGYDAAVANQPVPISACDSKMARFAAITITTARAKFNFDNPVIDSTTINADGSQSIHVSNVNTDGSVSVGADGWIEISRDGTVTSTNRNW